MNKVEYYLNEIENNPFPQTVINNASIRRNFNTLQLTELSKYNNCCAQLIQTFHPSLWLANRKGFKSPFCAWSDREIMIKCIENRLKYIGDDLSLVNIRAGLTIAKLAPKVSVFRPALAKYILTTYANNFTEIFDPCSGYSGRLLGAKALNKKYVGQDINYRTVTESNNLIDYFNFKDCFVRCVDSLSTKGSYECLFTCSPYSDLEHWNQDIEDLTCDEWIDICLKNYTCKRYIFVVNSTVKYSKYIKEVLQNKSYMSNSKEYVLVMDKDII